MFMPPMILRREMTVLCNSDGTVSTRRKKTVDTHTHNHFAVLRLQVDIARALGKRAFNEAAP